MTDKERMEYLIETTESYLTAYLEAAEDGSGVQGTRVELAEMAYAAAVDSLASLERDLDRHAWRERVERYFAEKQLARGLDEDGVPIARKK